ncbi:MAG TPA: alpha-2-macroglobulin family protein, partial [Longimicrobium sp.]|nr:alpha-2-macroglobulin family protein [Longimicrobium sp.]
PEAGVTVAIPALSLAATTDASGRYRLRGIPPGTHTVTISRAGLAPLSRVVVFGGEGVVQNFTVTPQEMLLEEVVVTGAAAGNVRERAAVSAPTIAVPPPPPPPPPAAPPPSPEAAMDAAQFKAPGVTVPATSISVRANFAALALWAPVQRTDAEGRVRATFDLPSNLTRYRIMAVAAEGGRSFGLGEGTLTVRQPLMVRPSAPRFLNFGDRFELPVVVQNQTGRPMEVQVAARAEGIRFSEPGKTVVVPANDRAEVRLAAEAVLPGTAVVQVVAVSGDRSDAAELTLPVYTPATAEAFATYGSLTEGAVELPLDVPEDAIPQFGGLEVTTSSTALHELTDAFLYLVRYRYESSEAIASRVLSVAALRDVLTAFRAEGLPPAAELADSMARDIRALQRMQTGDGGFNFWRSDRESWPYVSVHVTHALARAREKGFAVPEAMWSRALAYTANVERHIPRWYGPEARYAVRAYAAYVLDRAGHAGAVADLRALLARPNLDGVPLEVLGWLLSAAHGRAEFAPKVAEMLRILNNRATETASTATFTTRYEEGEYLLLHSSRRADAVVLEALLEADPRNELATKTVRGLLGGRRQGRWSNTQENAWVLLALDRYFEVYEGQTPELMARVWLGDRFAGENRFSGRTADRHHVDVPMPWLVRENPNSVTLAMEGTGRMYYRAGLRYAPRDLDLAPLNQGFAVERTYEPVDDAGDVVRGADGRWRVRAGARVRITVTMTAPSRRLHVALVDPLPAGFEPVNAALLGSEDVPPRQDGDVSPLSRRGGWSWWWGPWYEHQNLRDDRVEAFASHLPAGVYTYTYVARATTPGLFIAPPPRAEEMYSPETFGRGATDR